MKSFSRFSQEKTSLQISSTLRESMKQIILFLNLFWGTHFAYAQDVSGYRKLFEANRYALFPHKETYFLPVTYNWMPHEDIYSKLNNSSMDAGRGDFYQPIEAEFQISFLLPVYRRIAQSNLDLIFAYTHCSWWQLYNEGWSRPFRETNYTPELFVRNVLESSAPSSDVRLVAYDAGFLHQSNGQTQELSRSWNRLFVRAYLRSSSAFFILSGWWRVPESYQDDNPDIRDYMGIGDVEIYKTWGPHSLNITFPLAWHPGIDVKYSYPWRDEIRWFVDFKYGYGQSLIEYDRKTQRIGVGIILESFLDQRSPVGQPQ